MNNLFRPNSPGAVYGLWSVVIDRGTDMVKVKKSTYQIVAVSRKLWGGAVTLSCNSGQNRAQEANRSKKRSHGHSGRSPTSYHPKEQLVSCSKPVNSMRGVNTCHHFHACGVREQNLKWLKENLQMDMEKKSCMWAKAKNTILLFNANRPTNGVNHTGNLNRKISNHTANGNNRWPTLTRM